MSVLITGMEMPKSCDYCRMLEGGRMDGLCHAACKWLDDSEYWTWYVYPEGDIDYSKPCNCPLVSVPPHGRLIDADALIDDLKRQCKEVFRVNAVSPDDFWITRNEAYNERLWGTWCESFYGYLQTRPTVIPAEEGE